MFQTFILQNKSFIQCCLQLCRYWPVLCLRLVRDFPLRSPPRRLLWRLGRDTEPTAGRQTAARGASRSSPWSRSWSRWRRRAEVPGGKQMTTGGAGGRSRSTGDSPSSRTCSSYIDSSSPARKATAGLRRTWRRGWMAAPSFLNRVKLLLCVCFVLHLWNLKCGWDKSASTGAADRWADHLVEAAEWMIHVPVTVNIRVTSYFEIKNEDMKLVNNNNQHSHLTSDRF